MPSFVIHALLPLLFLLAIRPLDARKVWVMWPLTILPDFDYFFGLHRAAGANLFVLLPFVAGLVWARQRGKTAVAQFMIIGLVYLGSHLLMDMMTGGIVPFYPLSDWTACYYAEISIVTATNTPSFDFGACSHPGIPTVAPLYPWLSDSDSAMLAFILPAGVGMGMWSAWRLRKEASRGENA